MRWEDRSEPEVSQGLGSHAKDDGLKDQGNVEPLLLRKPLLLSPGVRWPNLRFRKNSAYRMEMDQRFQDTEDKETREKAGAVTSKEIEVNQCGIIKRT